MKLFSYNIFLKLFKYKNLNFLKYIFIYVSSCKNIYILLLLLLLLLLYFKDI